MRKLIGWSLTWELPAQQVEDNSFTLSLGREPLGQNRCATDDTATELKALLQMWP